MGPDEEYLEAYEKSKLLLEKQLNRHTDIKTKQQVLNNPSPPTIKRDHSVRQEVVKYKSFDEVYRDEIQKAFPDPEPGRYRNGHKGQKTKEITLNRRRRSISKTNRRINRQRRAA